MGTTRYKVVHCLAIGNGTFALAGVFEGEQPDVGSVGVASSPGRGVSVEVLGFGVVDPNLAAPGLLVKVVAGNANELNGTTFEFEGTGGPDMP